MWPNQLLVCLWVQCQKSITANMCFLQYAKRSLVTEPRLPASRYHLNIYATFNNEHVTAAEEKNNIFF